MEITKIVQEIQYVLAPAVMVSSSALLLLGYQNKFSNLASRFRALNHEKRLLVRKDQKDETEKERLLSVEQQIDHLMARARHVKNAIVMAYGAIICFAVTSVLIFLNVYAYFQLYQAIIVVFLAGLFLTLAGAACLIAETRLFYKVIALERKS